MVAISNSTSLTFLKEEIDGMLGEAERQLESWVDNPADKQPLQATAEVFHQLRGIFQVLELSAAALMSEEMELALQRIQQGGPVTAGDAVSQAIVLLSRYMEYVQLKDRAVPELLISGINDLRRSQGKPLILESHFFSVDLSRERFPKADSQPAFGAEQVRLSRRLRHMYQVGFVELLRASSNNTSSLKLMARAMGRFDRLCGDRPLGKLWWVGSAVLSAMVEEQMPMTPARKSLLANYDRQMKRVVYEGEQALASEPPLLLLKESIYLVSLASHARGVVGEVKQAYDLRTRLLDSELQAEISLMAGGSGSVLRTLAENLRQELGEVKHSLDMAAQGAMDTDYAEMAQSLDRVAGSMIMVNLNKEARALRELAARISPWPADFDVASNDFLAVVDELLLIENGVAMLERSLQPSSDLQQTVNNTRISLYQLDEARKMVVVESRAGLALVKKSIASFLESEGDRMHLANLPGTLATVAGGLTFLDLARAKSVMDACRLYMESLLAPGSEMPGTEQIETLADALSSVDYYLEIMEELKPIGDSVLEIAEESMEALGYPVVRGAAV